MKCIIHYWAQDLEKDRMVGRKLIKGTGLKAGMACGDEYEFSQDEILQLMKDFDIMLIERDGLNIMFIDEKRRRFSVR